MHAKRKQEQNELEDGDYDGAGLQIYTPKLEISG
jgi:hypothetical protein